MLKLVDSIFVFDTVSRDCIDGSQVQLQPIIQLQTPAYASMESRRFVLTFLSFFMFSSVIPGGDSPFATPICKGISASRR